MAPLEEFVGDACRTRSRFVGHAGEIPGDLLVGDGHEISRGEGEGVGGVRVGDRLRDDGEKPIRQDLAEVCVGGGKSAIEFEEGGNLVGTSPMTPGRGLPQGVAGDSGEVIVGPSAFHFGDGLPQGLDGISA